MRMNRSSSRWMRVRESVNPILTFSQVKIDLTLFFYKQLKTKCDIGGGRNSFLVRETEECDRLSGSHSRSDACNKKQL
jgi:hypothetical protein